MAKNLIEFSAYNADVVSYDNYDSTKTVLGPDIFKFSGATQPDYFIAPNETTFRDVTQDTGVSNWGDIDAITYQGSLQWVFCLKGNPSTTTTTDIAMYEFNKDTYSYSYIGEIRCTGADTTARNSQGIKANLDYYYTGTVEVTGNTVSGTGTNWLEDRVAIGSRIGFGSTNSNDITNWYRITDYPLMINEPSLINGAPSCVAVDPSTGKIYIGGAFTNYNGTSINRIARLNTDGTIDNTFNPGAGFNNTVTIITIDSAGKLYVGGSFTTYDGVAANRIIKLNSDGTKDATFDNTTGFNSTINEIKLDSLGQIWVGGQFTTYKGVSAPYLTKLNTDGTRDVTYPNTVNPNTTVNTIAVDSNDDVYIGGNFTQVGTPANNSRYIAKISKTGGLDATFIVGAAGTSNAFSSLVYSIFYKSSTNTIVVGGNFSSWKGVSNLYLTEISSTGDALISSAETSSSRVYSIISDSSGNLYTNQSSGITTKRSLTTLRCDPLFTPNVVYQSITSFNTLALSPTASKLYVISSDITVDSGIVCVDANTGERDVNFLTSQDYKSQVLTINSTASYPAGTPYVIEELKIFTLRTSLGTMIVQGISKDDFTQVPTSLTAPQFNFMGLSKGIYNILDTNFNSNSFAITSQNSSSSKDLRILTKESETIHYLYVVSTNGRISRYNVKSAYITQLGTTINGVLRFSRPTEVIVTSNGVNSTTGGSITGFGTGKFTIGTLQTGSAAGIKSIFVDVSVGVGQTQIDTIENNVAPIYAIMNEVPPGSSETFTTAGNVGRVYFMQKIDRLLILNSSSTAKSYITNFRTDLITPTLTSTLYSRDTFDNLAVENSYDIAFLVNGNQLQGSTSNINAPKYPDTLGTGFFGAVENGVLHLCRPLATIQNNLYSVPIECEAEYVNFSNNVFITPKYTLTNVLQIKGLYLNTKKQYGSYRFNIAPEPIVIEYRTSGIDDNSGSWTKFDEIDTLNDQINNDGTSSNLTIQFRFSFKVAGNTCLVNKIYGFSLIYEDDRSDSHYSPSISKSSLSNRIFAWRQSEPWFGNIPDLKIRLYNTTTNKIVFFDTISNSASGTWQYSTDGTTWLTWDASVDNVGNYIRYVADFIPAGIKLRVGLNTI